jgi:hypothetical protein
MLCFVVAGIIEGFVTPSGLPTFARVGVGVLVEVGFLTWVVLRGQDAVARGLTGTFGETPVAPLTPDDTTASVTSATAVPSLSA